MGGFCLSNFGDELRDMFGDQLYWRLPQGVQELVDVVGLESALLLVEAFPRVYSKGHPSGQPAFYIPKNLHAEHRLVDWVGWDKAKALVRRFGGEVVYPGICAGLVRELRNREIRRWAENGCSAREIGEFFEMSERQARRVIKNGEGLGNGCY